MKRTMILGVMVAIGSLAATPARAQDDTAGTGPTTMEKQTATSEPAYGSVVDEPATVDANGVPVAKPNPLSDFLKRSREQGATEVEMPLVDDFRTEGSATDGQTN